MTLSGTSSLIDSSPNEKEGVIYLKSGVSLTISGDRTLELITNKNMAINDRDLTFLTIKGGKIGCNGSFWRIWRYIFKKRNRI